MWGDRQDEFVVFSQRKREKRDYRIRKPINTVLLPEHLPQAARLEHPVLMLSPLRDPDPSTAKNRLEQLQLWIHGLRLFT